jgi:hypothetical protein
MMMIMMMTMMMTMIMMMMTPTCSVMKLPSIMFKKWAGSSPIGTCAFIF